MTAGLSLLVYTLVDATDAGWGSTQTIGLLAASAALLAIFVAIESRSASPLVPFQIFRRRTLTGANVVGLLVGASLFSMFFFISLYMQQVLDYSPIKAGFSYLPLAITIIISAGVASQLVTRLGFKPVLIAGLGFIAAGLIWFSQVSVGGSYVADVLPAIAARGGRPRVRLRAGHDRGGGRGAGTRGGAGERPHQHLPAGGRRARPGDPGHDRQLAHRRPVHAAGGNPAAMTNALNEGFQSAFLAGAGFALLGMVLAFVLIRGSDSRAHVQLGREGTDRPVEAGA